MQGGGFHPWNPVDFTLKSGGFHPWNLQISPRFDLWNPPKIIKASVLAKTLQFDECRVGAMTKNFMKLPDLTLKSGGFHPWNLVDFTQISPVKSTQIIKASVSAKTLQFDECRVGAMTKDFMKSARFHLKSTGFHEICQISPEIHWISWNLLDFIRISWNLVDFMKSMKSGRFHHEIWWISGEIRCFRNQLQMFQQKLFWFYKVWGGFHLKSAGFHEIHQISPEIHWISWNLLNFIWISWNPVDFMKIWQISPWNLVDFRWNQMFQKSAADVSAKTSDFTRFGVDFTWNPPDFIRISWNPADFMWNRKTFARNCNSMF